VATGERLERSGEITEGIRKRQGKRNVITRMKTIKKKPEVKPSKFAEWGMDGVDK